MVELRALTPADEPVIWQMLALAAHDCPEAVMTQPRLARYAEHWGRAGDCGWLALAEQRPIGAAWLQL